MAITIDLSGITVDTTAEEGTIVDGSTYTSPSRAGCGVFIKVYKTDLNGNRVALDHEGNATGPNDDTSWTFDYDTDGWHQIFYIAVPDFAVASYVLYDAVYRPSSEAVYRAKGAVSITTEADLDNTADWEVISEPTSLCLNIGASNESDNLTAITSIGIYNIVLGPITKENFGTKAGEAFLEASSTYRRSEDVRMYELLGLAVDGMEIANNRQEYSLGEIIARRAISLCSSC
jgi:hypothetical protein